jgi:hypothetical protein
MNLSGIDDSLERTDHHLPYPLRKIRLTAALVIVVTTVPLGALNMR